MDRLIVDTTPTPEDWRAYCGAINTRMRTAVRLWMPVAIAPVVHEQQLFNSTGRNSRPG
jgi:hypothetical protein